MKKVYTYIWKLKTVLILIWKRDFFEIFFRMRRVLGHIDLENVSLEQLGLSPERSKQYQNSGGEYLEQIMNRLKISTKDAIIDFGCGKGGALITFSKYPFFKVAGVELSPELVKIANNNIRKLNIRNVEIFCSDAGEFNDLDNYSFIYLFNPFPFEVMKLVMENVRQSLIYKPRIITIIYLNPIYHEAITVSGLSKIQEIECDSIMCNVYSNLE